MRTNFVGLILMAFTSSFLLSFRTRLSRPSSCSLKHRTLFRQSSVVPVRMAASKIEDPKSLTEEDWKARLSPQEYYILRQKGTERAGTGAYDKFVPPTKDSYFACAACGNPLYSAAAKFSSGCGWPAFDLCYKGAVKTKVDMSFGMRRIEIMCSECDGHLGHVFEGERMTPTNERHCVNSVSWARHCCLFNFILLTPEGFTAEY